MASDTAGAVEVREVFVQQAISFIDRVSVESGELALQTLLERPQVILEIIYLWIYLLSLYHRYLIKF